MCNKVEELVETLVAAVSTLDAARLSADAAAQLVDVFARAERICAAGRTLAAARVQETRAWRAYGHRTAAEWVASRTGASLSEAITSLQTAHGLSELPATREAFVSGMLSPAQAAEITAAATADPSSESSLLDSAKGSTLAELREECRNVRAAAASDEDANERIRRGRYLRHWTDRDGAVRFDARLSPDDGARLIAEVTSRAAAAFAHARRSGHREPLAAYRADALVSLCDAPAGPRALVHVHVDQAALERRRVAAGETCAIPGVGPVSVTSARRLAADGIVKAIVKKGADVTRVAHLGRTIPAPVRTALEARDQTCVVPGCDMRTGLEIDHIIPFAQGGPTRLSNLARLCRFHHAQKTHHGWRLGGNPGAWTWTRSGRRTSIPERSPPSQEP